MVSVVSEIVWFKLSTPWAEQRGKKLDFANAQLIDSVICKEVIVSQATENEERLRLQKAIDADRQEIRQICLATLCSEAIKVSVFSMVVPLVFLYVFLVDPTMDRLFQLLFLVIVLDEVTRAVMSLIENGPVREEYQCAKAKFCHVLGVEESILFPPDFPWLQVSSKDEPAPSRPKDDDSTLSTDDSLTSSNVAAKVDEELSQSVELILQNPSESDCINMTGISFGYTIDDGNVSHVVDNLSLSFALGGHYAIMGESGCGKSTIFKVRYFCRSHVMAYSHAQPSISIYVQGLSGIMKPLGGHFTVAGKLIHPTSRWWRKQVGIVNQNSILLNRSLRENLCYGLDERSDEEIIAALDKVNLKAWVKTLPQALDTMIRFNGNEFSGGQRQRLQIARLFLSSRPIVLLDEFTSALDSDTTDDILRVMESFLAKKTLIMISHDVQTLCLARKVMKMKVGGTFEDVTDV